MSEYGRAVTKLFVNELVKNDWCIVSGLARGVDGLAHEACLVGKGETIAVLANGVDLCYPPEHASLRRRILENGGLVVSEYEEGVKPIPDYFRQRDKLMVRISDAVLVTECPRKSGVKITVAAAAEAGKNVYVVPGPITSTSYHGSVEIIRNGGIPVYSPEDLMEQLKFQ